MIKGKVVPEEFLEELASGSHEVFCGEVNEAVQFASGRFFPGVSSFDRQELVTLATFPHHVVVLSEDGSIFKASLEMSDDRKLHVAGIERIKTEAVDGKSSNKLMRSRLKEAAGLFVDGDIVESCNRLRDVMELVDPLSDESQKALACKLKKKIESGGEWTVFLEVNKGELVGEDFRGADMKWQKLCDGTIEESEVDEHKDVVLADLDCKIGRIREMTMRAAEGFEGYLNGRPKVKSVRAQRMYLEFDEFANDLFANLSDIVENVEKLKIEPCCVSGLAGVHDAIASRMYDYEKATSLIRKISQKFGNG